jgi:hypothetical protein
MGKKGANNKKNKSQSKAQDVNNIPFPDESKGTELASVQKVYGNDRFEIQTTKSSVIWFCFLCTFNTPFLVAR